VRDGLPPVAPADQRHHPKYVIEHWVCLVGKGWLGPWPEWDRGSQTARAFASIAREDYGDEAFVIKARYPLYRVRDRPHAEPGEVID
jgi:hypothetical protein